MNVESQRHQMYISIKKWLDEEGTYKIKEESTEQIGMHYILKVEYLRNKTRKPVPFSIQFPTTKRDLFQIVINLQIVNKVTEKLETLNDNDLDDFHWDLTINILRTNCFYESSIANNGTINNIQLWEDAYFDGFSKDRLIQAIRKVINGYSLIIAQFDRLTGEPRPRPDTNPAIM